MDLSLYTTRPLDVSDDTISAKNTQEIQKETVEEGEHQVGLLGNNTNSAKEKDDSHEPQTDTEETTKKDKYKEALDALCKMWSEVKLLQMKPSDVKYNLKKATVPKGDNVDPVPPNSPVRFSHAGRPLRKATSAFHESTVDSADNSEKDSDFIKSPGRKQNLSKPRALGPSASRVVAKNKKTSVPATVLPSTSGGYTRSVSPVYL